MTWHDSRAVLSILPHLQTRRFLSVYAPLKLFTILWFISYESELMNFKERKPSFWPLSIALLLNYSAFLQVQAMFFAFARQRGFYLRSLFCRLVSLPTRSLALSSRRAINCLFLASHRVALIRRRHGQTRCRSTNRLTTNTQKCEFNSLSLLCLRYRAIRFFALVDNVTCIVYELLN